MPTRGKFICENRAQLPFLAVVHIAPEERICPFECTYHGHKASSGSSRLAACGICHIVVVGIGSCMGGGMYWEGTCRLGE